MNIYFFFCCCSWGLTAVRRSPHVLFTSEAVVLMLGPTMLPANVKMLGDQSRVGLCTRIGDLVANELFFFWLLSVALWNGEFGEWAAYLVRTWSNHG